MYELKLHRIASVEQGYLKVSKEPSKRRIATVGLALKMRHSVPVAKKRALSLSVTMRAITNSSTPLSVACFYGLLILLILAPIYPVMAQANFQAIMKD